MNTSLKIFKKFVWSTVFISIFILVFNFCFATVYLEKGGQPIPSKIFIECADNLKYENNNYVLAEKYTNNLKENNIWAMLISQNGEVIWNFDLPDEIPRNYTLTDVASFTRSYLKDYPVYTWQHKSGLIVFGSPKNSYAKYYITVPVTWMRSILYKVPIIILVNIFLAVILSFIIGAKLIKSIKSLINGIQMLSKEKTVHIEIKGILKDLASSINKTSKLLNEKNEKLKKRDKARLNWIAGISHDIRTPLSMILGYSSELEDDKNLSVIRREQAEIIRNQGIKIKELVEDLNLVSMLEYEMQPIKKKDLRPSVLLRQVVCEFINNGLDEKYNIELNIDMEDILINADERLIKRVFTNLIQNSINHNPAGCEIVSSLKKKEEMCLIEISDNGQGVSNEKLDNLLKEPYTAEKKHGLGLLIVERVVKAHGGQIFIESEDGHGFCTKIMLVVMNHSTK